MCEGNLCIAATEGGGRIQAFVRTKEETWQWSHEIALPEAAEFEDYAAISFHGDQIAVVSQSSSRVWIGGIDRDAHAFSDDGVIYKFPEKSYCNVEGVDWLSDDLLVMVSDRMKAGKQAKRCVCKDQSIHVFRIPESKKVAAGKKNLARKKSPASTRTPDAKTSPARKKAPAKQASVARKKSPAGKKQRSQAAGS